MTMIGLSVCLRVQYLQITTQMMMNLYQGPILKQLKNYFHKKVYKKFKHQMIIF